MKVSALIAYGSWKYWSVAMSYAHAARYSVDESRTSKHMMNLLITEHAMCLERSVSTGAQWRRFRDKERP